MILSGFAIFVGMTLDADGKITADLLAEVAGEKNAGELVTLGNREVPTLVQCVQAEAPGPQVLQAYKEAKPAVLALLAYTQSVKGTVAMKYFKEPCHGAQRGSW